MSKYIIAIDEGTTSTRVVLFDPKTNTIVDKSHRKFKQYYPSNGWVEHNGEEIWNAVKKCLYEILERNNLSPSDIYSIGITNQRETVIAWDKRTGKPVHNAIVWQCRRTAKYCKSLPKKTKELIRQKTGLILDAYFSGTKMRWLLRNVPEVKKLAKEKNLCFGTIDTFLAFKLTRGKVFATDTSNASRTLLTALDSPMQWDEEMLSLFKIPRHALPEIKNSADDYGYAKTKFGEIPIRAMIGDQMASLFGQGCHEKNEAKNTYGTGAFLLVNTGEEYSKTNKKLLSTVAWTIDNKTTYAIEGSVFNVGSALNFFKNNLELFDSYDNIDSICNSVPSSQGVYVLPAFTGLGSPHWQPNARGNVLGLTLASKKANVLRACVESFAYSVYDIVKYLNHINIHPKELSVDGGVSKSDFLLQFQADILKLPLARVKLSESTSLGAIYLAGLQSGAYKSIKEIRTHIEKSKVFYPTMDDKTIEKNLKGWKKTLQTRY